MNVPFLDNRHILCKNILGATVGGCDVSININKEVAVGLDQYAYAAAQAGQNAEWWDGAELDPDTRDYRNNKVTKPREIAYWRKHPNLQGWMQRLWLEKLTIAAQPESEFEQVKQPTMFNGVELELTWEDLDQLEEDIRNERLPGTTGFFFGENSDDYYRDQDLEFVKQARAELFMGLKVFYNSSW